MRRGQFPFQNRQPWRTILTMIARLILRCCFRLNRQPFGKDFAYIGNQYHVEALGHDHYIDLLFYNRELCSLVAIELKTGAFKPIYLGELNTYLQVLDDFVKKTNENQSVGLVLCKSADKAYAEYAVRDYSKPMGVATYKTASDMPERLRRALPDIEELKKLL